MTRRELLAALAAVPLLSAADDTSGIARIHLQMRFVR